MIYITRAQRRAERRAIVLGIVFLLIGSISLLLPLFGISGWTLSFTSFAAPSVYIFMFWLYGWPRLRIGLAVFEASGGVGIDENRKSYVEKICAGLLINANADPDKIHEVQIIMSTKENELDLLVKAPAGIDISSETRIAMLDAVVGADNPYLYSFFRQSFKIGPMTDMSAHTRLASMKAMEDARLHSKEVRIFPRRSSTQTRGGYIDQMMDR